MTTLLTSASTIRTTRNPAGITVRVVKAGELASYVEAWQRLADASLVPNIFYEPWMALPALAASESTGDLHFLFIFAGEEMWGFVPLQMQARCLLLPIRNLALWQHRYCYLTAPLLDAAHAREALEAFWHWFENNPLDVNILDTNWLLADGPFHALWVDFAFGRASLMLNDFSRALYQPDRPLVPYLSQLVSRKSTIEFGRRERRLAELGTLEFQSVTSLVELDEWIEDFLKLEAAGWKGREGGRAFALYGPDAAYFRTVCREGFLRERIMLLSLTLDGKPIAMRHTLLAGHGAYAFRTAYDEQYAKYSPGTILELETMRRIYGHPEVRWMDSCAAPRHHQWNRVWRERRMIRRSLFSRGSAAGDFLVSILPLARWAGKAVRMRPTPDHLQISTRRGL